MVLLALHLIFNCSDNPKYLHSIPSSTDALTCSNIQTWTRTWIPTYEYIRNTTEKLQNDIQVSKTQNMMNLPCYPSYVPSYVIIKASHYFLYSILSTPLAEIQPWQMTFVQPPPYGRTNNTLNVTHPAIPLLCAFQTRPVFVWGVLYRGTGRPSREAEQELRCRREVAGGALAGQPVCLCWELSHDASVLSTESAESGWAEWPSHPTCQEEIKKTMTSLTKRQLTLISWLI